MGHTYQICFRAWARHAFHGPLLGRGDSRVLVTVRVRKDPQSPIDYGYTYGFSMIFQLCHMPASNGWFLQMNLCITWHDFCLGTSNMMIPQSVELSSVSHMSRLNPSKCSRRWEITQVLKLRTQRLDLSYPFKSMSPSPRPFLEWLTCCSVKPLVKQWFFGLSFAEPLHQWWARKPRAVWVLPSFCFQEHHQLQRLHQRM